MLHGSSGDYLCPSPVDHSCMGGCIKCSHIKGRYHISGIILACGDGDECMVLQGLCQRLCQCASGCAGGWGNECTSYVRGCAVAVSEDVSEDVRCISGCLVITW